MNNYHTSYRDRLIAELKLMLLFVFGLSFVITIGIFLFYYKSDFFTWNWYFHSILLVIILLFFSYVLGSIFALITKMIFKDMNKRMI